MAENAYSHNIAYQGQPGAYSHQAARQYYAESAHFIPYPTFSDMLQAVATQTADYAVLPIENALAGFVFPAYAALRLNPTLCIQAELSLRIEHCLLGTHDATLEHLDTVMSHPQALAQCSQFLQRNGLTSKDYSNTATAAAYIAQNQDSSTGAIAHAEAAGIYGLKILAQHIANQPHNQTRFLIISRLPSVIDILSTPCKTLLSFNTQNINQALPKLGKAVEMHNVKLMHIQPIPLDNSLWQHEWVAELKGCQNQLNTLTNEIKRDIYSVQSWGIYPAEQPNL